MSAEVLLFTKSDYENELRCWLDWHLNIIGFNHVMIFDNESNVDIKSIIADYPEGSIDYKYVSGNGKSQQYSLYTEYLKTTKYEWSIALDDDEYLYISKDFNYSIHSLIDSIQTKFGNKYNKYYILWINMFSKEPISSHSDLYINTHTCYSYKVCNIIKNLWSEDNGYGKCLIHNLVQHFYSRQEVYTHIPKSISSNNETILVYKDLSDVIKIKHHYQNNVTLNPNADCFIAHFQYKSLNDWYIKCSRARVYGNMFAKKSVYNILYKYKMLFKPLMLLKDRWDEFCKSKKV